MKEKKEFIGLDASGFEHPDPRPVEIPTRLKLPQRQVDRVREIIRQEMSRKAEGEGFESFEEADDFDIPGEDPVSPYEEVFEPVVESSSPGNGPGKEKGNVEVGGQRGRREDVDSGPGDTGKGSAAPGREEPVKPGPQGGVPADVE